MLFWKMFWVASFKHGHMRISMLWSLFMLFLAPPIGLIFLFFHIMIHAHHIYSAKIDFNNDRCFIHWCHNRDPDTLDLED